MSFRSLATSIILSCFVLGGVAQAVPIYSNGTGNYAGNKSFSLAGVFVAQDFALFSPAALTGLSYNAYTTSSTVPVTAVNVKIYANSAGSVGSQLYSGAFSVASETVTGSDGSYTLKDFFVDLPGWNLDAGAYWLALRVDPAQTDMHWTIPTSTPLGYSSKIGNSAGDPGSYGDYSQEHAFTLFEGEGTPTEIPEPSAAALLALGIAALSAFAKSARKAL